MHFTVQDLLLQKGCRNATIVVALQMPWVVTVVVSPAHFAGGYHAYCFLFFQACRQLLSHGRQDLSWLPPPARPPHLRLIASSTGQHLTLSLVLADARVSASQSGWLPWLQADSPGASCFRWFLFANQFRAYCHELLLLLQRLIMDTLSFSLWPFATDIFCFFPGFDLAFNKLRVLWVGLILGLIFTSRNLCSLWLNLAVCATFVHPSKLYYLKQISRVKIREIQLNIMTKAPRIPLQLTINVCGSSVLSGATACFTPNCEVWNNVMRIILANLHNLQHGKRQATDF